ncbi:hypothetical protein MTR67_002552 [Solanum verrucosum]|uniref:Uncharacterized protein n=1 Tax=Solanum verrucosum TaxID=315347 RepID=A0AAF0PR81_SOLVR|nr:hypothetical protein MTR67_002552 [Solanum verrucosum]
MASLRTSLGNIIGELGSLLKSPASLELPSEKCFGWQKATKGDKGLPRLAASFQRGLSWAKETPGKEFRVHSRFAILPTSQSFKALLQVRFQHVDSIAGRHCHFSAGSRKVVFR